MATIFIFSMPLTQHIKHVHAGQKVIFQMPLYSLDKAWYSYTSHMLCDVFSRTLLYCIKSSIVLNVNHMEHYVNMTEAVSSADYV